MPVTERGGVTADETDLTPRLEVDRETWVVLLLVPLVLTLLNYFSLAPHFVRFFPQLQAPPELLNLYALLWWAGWSVVAYLAVPAVALKLLGRRLADYGLRLPRRSPHLLVYPALYVVMIAPLFWAARSPAFLETYPFYRFAPSHPQYWLAFEAAYAVQFVALEFFFRGFLIFALHRRIGDMAVLVSTIPYTMIHFHKPLAECLGAIVAGVALGFLSLRTRSIAGGVAVHWAVAFTMDLLAVAARTGRLPL